MITIIITAYGQPESTKKAIESVLSQKIGKDFKIIVADPTIEGAQLILNKYQNNKHIVYFEDPDLGKSHALNLLLKKYWSSNTNDILIFTDGDVFLKPNSIKEIIKAFEDPAVGVVCGHPVPLNPRDNMCGYWTHLSFDEMNSTRRSISNKQEFFEASGYLFAIRNGVIKEFQSQASEDNVIPILFRQKGYKIKYVESAEVAVMGPQKFSEYLTQKKRNIKGHIALSKLNLQIPKRKNTFLAEVLRGLKIISTHPRSPKEFIWAILLAVTRILAWKLAYYEVYLKKKKYKDGWREEENLTTTEI